MCKLLHIPRSSLYNARSHHHDKYRKEDDELTNKIKIIFKNSRNNYGSRKIKVELAKLDLTVSKRKICRIMKENGLVSNYTVKRFKVNKSTCNNDPISNELNRNFNQEKRMNVIVSDLTYVNVDGKWNYICTIIDLYNREIVGYAAGKSRDAKLVKQAINSIHYDLSKINLLHTDYAEFGIVPIEGCTIHPKNIKS